MNNYEVRNRILNELYKRMTELEGIQGQGHIPFHIEYMNENELVKKIGVPVIEIGSNCKWLELRKYITMEREEQYSQAYELTNHGYTITVSGIAKISTPFTKNYKPEMDELNYRDKLFIYRKEIVTFISGWIVALLTNLSKINELIGGLFKFIFQ
jgi:hypothetical protein